MEAPQPRTWDFAIVASGVIGCLGLVVHNLADLPGSTVFSPETLFPALVYVVLTGLWFLLPARRTAARLLLAWGWISLIGGILSVLPLPFLPFEPAQTVSHYAFHVLYAVTQLPLILVTTFWLRGARAYRAPKRGK
ncbi:hypothetical protein LQ757_04665 [Agromyces sp. SYSU K20354]|uniref:hypothetical protein n=1 Tax=Agromyces cavernae TaxID=2898659 RepID=UPI001E3A89F2|nr:hypothetical protein [Agromyces cavernae]MCD2441564.1 hypothetical protein [Agromyces cavernae]